MKSFRQYIKEEDVPNSTGMFTYGLGFQVDTVRSDFDVEDFTDKDDPNDRKDRKYRKHFPWEVENAIEANSRRDMVLRWMKSAGANSKKSVTNKSLPLTPDWQTTKR